MCSWWENLTGNGIVECSIGKGRILNSKTWQPKGLTDGLFAELRQAVWTEKRNFKYLIDLKIVFHQNQTHAVTIGTERLTDRQISQKN